MSGAPPAGEGEGSAYLRATPVVDWHAPAVLALARELAAGAAGPVEVARRCFEHVRDRLRHSVDAGDEQVTCAASEVLAAGTGLCFAKSHLLVALLRASGLKAGFSYQRLANRNGTFSLHGLAAVDLPGVGWYRLDPRGNKLWLDARFDPPHERLAYAATGPGEWDSRSVWAEPLPEVIAALRAPGSVSDVVAHLPDHPVPPEPARS
ncbi:transglutaminase-like domain-containing protein [Anaeromyxobacter paludicola]|uniref:Cro/Cl family transcriptional regulator n=1 Tax=Anaeromyxobacter paludicola TaxID=2918171 RepID=A0ABM7X8Y7_9BACT|nr:transglutaminase family protein [Anaeromyxobacter paludicola]BDG08324.1 Cro/Cl family transcriptional regulator [Anaeromyxobacter paludicola]